MLKRTWSGRISIRVILNAQLKPNLDHFILNYSIGPLHSMFSYIKLVEKIPRSVHFVVITLKLLFIYFVNVIKLNHFGRNFKIWLTQNITLIMTSIILINYLVSLKNVGSHIFCCVVNFIFTAVSFKMTPQTLGLLNLFLSLNVIWNIIWPRKKVNYPSILKSGVLTLIDWYDCSTHMYVKLFQSFVHVRYFCCESNKCCLWFCCIFVILNDLWWFVLCDWKI